MTADSGEPLGVGAHLARSLELVLGTLPSLILLWLACLAPGALALGLAALSLGALPDLEFARAAFDAGRYGQLGAMLAVSAFDQVVQLLGACAAALALDGTRAGRAVGPLEALARAVGPWGRLVVTQALAFGLIALGTLCLVVPGVILSIRYLLLQPAVVLDGRWGLGALRRSAEVVGRDAGRIVGALTVALVAALATSVLLAVLIPLVSILLPSGVPLRLAAGVVLVLPAKLASSWVIATSVELFRHYGATLPAGEP